MRTPQPRRAGFIGLILAAGAGCARPAPAPPPQPLAVVEPAMAEPSLMDRDWGVLRSLPHGMKLALPEARAWFVAAPGPPGAAWELRHEPTGTSLSLRRWRAARLPQLEECERELRARTAGLSLPDESNLVAARQVRVPAGFVTRLSLLSLPGKEKRLRGQALAVGAGVGECIAAVALTECSTEEELGERLRLLDTALAHLRLTSVEDRVPAPPPVPPS